MKPRSTIVVRGNREQEAPPPTSKETPETASERDAAIHRGSTAGWIEQTSQESAAPETVQNAHDRDAASVKLLHDLGLL